MADNLTYNAAAARRMKQFLDKEMKNGIYQKNLPDQFVPEAVFSDGTMQFRNPPEPMPFDKVLIRLRTAVSNVDTVTVSVNGTMFLMQKAESDPLFDYYEKAVTVGEEKMNYFFLLQYKQETYYYCRIGTTDRKTCLKYQFAIIPGYKTPDWAKGAVMYQIFVDRFCNGDVGNDVQTREYYYLGGYSKRTEQWDQYPDVDGVREFYGGDLAGVIKRLDYLKELGIDAIYLNPIFVSPSNHKYDIQDYDYIDPHFGVIGTDGGSLLEEGETQNSKATKYRIRVTDKSNLVGSNLVFTILTQEAHKRGIKVILDGVFNHCGSFNKWLDHEGIYDGTEGYPAGAYESADSPYRSFFRFKEEHWPKNESYDGWWGHLTLPKLNYENSPELESYILKIASKWLSAPFYTDGWRLDVAADLGYSPEYNHIFWRKFREAVKKANPEALIIAEHYGDPYSWLQGNEWDSVMNYDAFMEPVTWFLTGMEKHSDSFKPELLSNSDHFFGSMQHFMTRFETQSLQVAMNELSNHDHSRFMTRTNHVVGRSAGRGAQAANEGIQPAVMREAVVIQFTWPGAPTIYYGDEAGVCGWSDPDNRRTYPWGHEDKSLLEFHREIIRLHKSYQALKTGSLLFLYGAQGVLSYGRFDKIDKFIVVVNNNDYEIEAKIPVWRLGVMENEAVCSLLRTDGNGYGFEAKIDRPKLGILTVKMPPVSAVILKNLSPMMT